MVGHDACAQCFPNMIYLHWGNYDQVPIRPFLELVRCTYYKGTYNAIAKDARVRVILERVKEKN